MPLHYKGHSFYKLMPSKLIEGGDIILDDGKGGESIYGDKFDDENFIVKFDRPFLLAMANKGPNTNKSSFFITL